ncbi:P-loop NTPase fold protein [Sphingomonas crocodyli]|nr:P-loop NTPase fold protein [Sphingomonas crocodyli]
MTNSYGEEPSKLQFIRDQAATEDFFGSHDRVARAIASVIANNKDLKVIGLLGRWGSGKSTVVAHVQKHLAADQRLKSHVFCYDAWLHQSDPPRRSFLETLIAFLIANNLTTEKRWKADLDILNRQVEYTETRSTPTLTIAGRIFLFSFALIPLGMQLIDHDWFQELGKAGFRGKAFYLGLLLLFAPALIGGVLALCAKGKDRENLWALFVNRQSQHQRNRTTRTPDPTTIEFQKLFRKVISAVPADTCQLIFVIDNLDRLHEAEAVEMWGTIRSFFLGSHGDELDPTRVNLPVVILPIDQDAITRMYAVEHGEAVAPKLARSFMDKTFDLTFHVASPPLSDWNRYLRDRLLAVFNEQFDERWAFQMGRLYGRWREADPANEITPRALNVTVNEAATLWLQWSREVTFVAIAYFVIFRDAIAKNVEQAVMEPAIDLSDLDPNWRSGVAALHYGVPPEVAIQILMEPRLLDAMSGRSPDQFKRQAALPGFKEVLQRILDKAHPMDPKAAAQTAVLLDELGIESDPSTESIWAALRARIAAGRPWEDLASVDADGLQAMLANCPSARLAPFIDQMAQKLSSADDSMITGEDGRRAFLRMTQALNEATERGQCNLPSIAIRGTVENYLNLVGAVGAPPNAAKLIDPPGSIQFAANKLAELLKVSKTAVGAGRKFEALMVRRDEIDWSSFLAAAYEVANGQPATHVGIAPALHALGRFYQTDDATKESVKTLSQNGMLTGRMNEFQSNRNDGPLAEAIALLIMSGGDMPPPNGISWSTIAEVPSFGNDVRNALLLFGEEAPLLRLVYIAANNDNVSPLCRAVATAYLRSSNLGRLAVRAVISGVDTYLTLFEVDDHARFAAQLPNYPNFWDELRTAQLNESSLRLFSLLALSDEPAISGAVRKSARAILLTHLRATSQETWLSSIQTGDEPLPSAQAFADGTKGSANIGISLFNALNSQIDSMVGDSLPGYAARWFAATRLLANSHIKTLFKNLRDYILAHAHSASVVPLLILGSDQLLDAGEFAKQGDRCVRLLLPSFLDDLKGREWLQGRPERVAAWLNSSGQDSRAVFADQLRQRWSQADDNSKASIQSLWDACNLEGHLD